MSSSPQSTSQEHGEQSNFGTAKSDTPDKSNFHNDGVPADAARIAIPIVILGKSADLGKKVATFLHPEYLVVHHATTVADLMSTLPTLKEPEPLAVFVGRGFSAEEQDKVEQQVQSRNSNVKVVRSEPVQQDVLDKFSTLPFADRAGHVSKALLDNANLALLPPTAEAVSQNAV